MVSLSVRLLSSPQGKQRQRPHSALRYQTDLRFTLKNHLIPARLTEKQTSRGQTDDDFVYVSWYLVSWLSEGFRCRSACDLLNRHHPHGFQHGWYSITIKLVPLISAGWIKAKKNTKKKKSIHQCIAMYFFRFNIRSENLEIHFLYLSTITVYNPVHTQEDHTFISLSWALTVFDRNFNLRTQFSATKLYQNQNEPTSRQKYIFFCLFVCFFKIASELQMQSLIVKPELGPVAKMLLAPPLQLEGILGLLGLTKLHTVSSTRRQAVTHLGCQRGNTPPGTTRQDVIPIHFSLQ